MTNNQLVNIADTFASLALQRHSDLKAPKGVRSCNSDNALIQSVLGWAPGIFLEDGIEKTYQWIHDQMAAKQKKRA